MEIRNKIFVIFTFGLMRKSKKFYIIPLFYCEVAEFDWRMRSILYGCFFAWKTLHFHPAQSKLACILFRFFCVITHFAMQWFLMWKPRASDIKLRQNMKIQQMVRCAEEWNRSHSCTHTNTRTRARQTKLSTQIHICLQCHSILWHTQKINETKIFSEALLLKIYP